MAVSAGEHPVDGSRLRQLVLAERGRISRRSRLRELVLGIQDGLFISLAVVTGLASANVAKGAVIAGAMAGAVAGALAKGTEAFLESRAEEELYDAEVTKEVGELGARRSVELDELALLLHEEGVAAGDARAAATLIATAPRAFAKTKVEKELGLAYREHPSKLAETMIVGLAYATAALIPLWPYFIWNLSTAMLVSLLSAGLALVAFAGIKARVANVGLIRNGAEVLLCGISAAVGYFVGWVGQVGGG